MIYKNKNYSSEERANDLIKYMTIDEKILQLAAYFPNGVKRLDIPNLQPGECLHGVATEEATCFPQAIALGSTWNPKLIENIACVIAKEARALGIHQCYSPMLGVARDPRWGRTQESYGEDPCLVSKIGEAFILGLQGKENNRFSKDKIIATAKHYVADGEPLAGSNGAAVDISNRLLHEVHLLPFKTAIEKAHVGSIMPAHHSLNGVPCHMNKYILRDVLRKEYGFDGFIVSDNGDIRMLYTGMNVAKDIKDAAKLALNAGVDSELAWLCPMGNNRAYGTPLLENVKNDVIDIKLIDTAVLRILKAKFDLGLFDEPENKSGTDEQYYNFNEGNDGNKHIHYADTKKSFGVKKANYKDILYSPEHDALAYEAAVQSVVLLKNDNILPLDIHNINKIAVIGPNANTKIMGGYSTPSPRYFVTVLNGIKTAVKNECEILYSQGCDPETFNETDIEKAVNTALQSDIVLLCVGGNELTCKENQDVDTLKLPGDQHKLIKAIHSTGKKIILILLHGRPNSIEWESKNINAIIEGWYLGQETGNALADILLGNRVPGGKLPITIPRNVGQLPCYYNKYPFGRKQNYYKSSPKPIYPFGFGLSYTNFQMTEPTMHNNIIQDGEPIFVSIIVKNIGNYKGDEVIQLYIRDEICSVVQPIKQLKSFKRITLLPNESVKVTFNITYDMLSFWYNGKWQYEKGKFIVMIGNCSNNTKNTYFELI